jgi:hypothetical protein
VRTRRFRSILPVLSALALVACSGDDGASSSPSATTPPPPVSPTVVSTAAPSVTPPSLPEEPLPSSGPASTDCVNGWASPVPRSPEFERAIDVIRRTTGVRGPLTVVEMRSFEGPESPPTDKGYLLVVQRWYVKLFSERDPAFQGRFLVESRRFGDGVAAVASYDTSGYGSPDWVGFQYDSTDLEARAYPGLPGTWEGIPYDFVRGGGGIEIPGLPQAVIGCLDGT